MAPGLVDRHGGDLRRRYTNVPVGVTTPSAPPPAMSQAGRITSDAMGASGMMNIPIFTPPAGGDAAWALTELDPEDLAAFSPSHLTGILVDVSPDMASALWTFVRMCNAGWTAQAFPYGGPDEARTPDRRAQAALDDILLLLKRRYGSVDVPINRLFVGAYTRGAFLAELVLDQDMRTFYDIATPDPAIIRFRRIVDPFYGPWWEMGQMIANLWYPLDRPTVRYIPVDPMPDSPYGRSPLGPAIFVCLFMLSILRDLRRVVQQQGWPRIDLSIDVKTFIAGLPQTIQQDPVQAAAALKRFYTQIQTEYSQLQASDAFVHTNDISVNRNVGTVDSHSLGAVDGLIVALERMITRALKTLPLLMGINDTTSETHAARQWEVYAQSIKSLQHPCEALLEYLLGLALEAQGISATIEFRFAELRDAELYRLAQTEQLRMVVARAGYNAGFWSMDEAANYATGKPSADATEPRFLERGEVPVPGSAWALAAAKDAALAAASGAPNGKKPGPAGGKDPPGGAVLDTPGNTISGASGGEIS